MAKEHFTRSEDYRSRYIAAHPGWRGKWYMCPYCGRFVIRERMQVDHIISIDLANRQWLYRHLTPKDGINSEWNLTAACEKCNLRKSNKGGWWIIRAKVGRGWYALVWCLLALMTACLAICICCGYLTPQGIREWIGSRLTDVLLWLRGYILRVLDVFLGGLKAIRTI